MIRPLGDRVVVRPEATAPASEFLTVVRNEDDPPMRGEVLAVGGELDGYVRPGDAVLFSKYGGVEVEDGGGGKLLVLRKNDLLAVVE